jgi:hypothetical protein
MSDFQLPTSAQVQQRNATEDRRRSVRNQQRRTRTAGTWTDRSMMAGPTYRGQGLNRNLGA